MFPNDVLYVYFIVLNMYLLFLQVIYQPCGELAVIQHVSEKGTVAFQDPQLYYFIGV